MHRMAIGIVAVTSMGGCGHKTPLAAAPPAPNATEAAKAGPPVISEFTAEPSAIQRGQSAVLRWRVKDATEIEINRGIGVVSGDGRRQVAPSDSTTYTLMAC
jgi:peptidoglycan-associated lipoprotein